MLLSAFLYLYWLKVIPFKVESGCGLLNWLPTHFPFIEIMLSLSLNQGKRIVTFVCVSGECIRLILVADYLSLR